MRDNQRVVIQRLHRCVGPIYGGIGTSNFIDNGEPLKISGQEQDVVRGRFLEYEFSNNSGRFGIRRNKVH